MEGEKTAQKFQSDLILENLVIRTMADDLGSKPKIPTETKPAASLPYQKMVPPQTRTAPPSGLPIQPKDSASSLSEKTLSFEPEEIEPIGLEKAKPSRPIEPIKPVLPPPPRPEIPAKAEKLPPSPPSKPVAPLPLTLQADRAPGPPKTQRTEAINKPKSPVLRFVGIIIVAVLIIGSGIFAYFYWFNSEETPISPPVTEQTPTPLFPTEHQIIISLDSETDLGNEIETAALDLKPAGHFTQLIVKRGGNYLNLAEVLAALDIQIPIQTMLLADTYSFENYTLFLYYQRSETDPVQTRLGLIIRNQDMSAFNNYLKDEEPNLPKTLEPMLMERLQDSSGAVFNDNNYRGIPIRYVNFPDSSLSIDYALWENNWLLITTSKESIYAALDKITTGF
ncbi:MAG: hypothetical protein PHQ47_03010 [Candidatus Portnoybacteria bacterium]|nr:hypothetical protein [Candidatus Portnoybacteria bacterium]